MKQFLSLVSLTVAIVSGSYAAPCGTGSLASYIELGPGGCTIGANTLFDFRALSGIAGATPISSGAVTLAPLGGNFDPGLSATVNTTANAGTLFETFFTYKVAGSFYTGDSITLTNSSASSDGAVTGIQDFCAGGIFGPSGVTGCTGIAGTLLTLAGTQNQDSTSFGPVNLLSVTDDFTLDGGLAGSASGGTMTNRFTAVPEPATFFVAGMGLALAAACASLSGRKEGNHDNV
jgi:PEP-CTERM motif